MTVVTLGSDNPYEGIVGYSRLVVRGDTAWVSGTTAVVAGVVADPGDGGAQTRQALATLGTALQRAGFALADVVRTRIYVTDIGRWEDVGRVHGEFFGDIRPAATMISAGLADPRMKIEIEVTARRAATS